MLTFFQIQLTKGKEGELQTFPTFGCQVFSQKNLLNWFTNTRGLMDGLVIKNLVLHGATIVPSCTRNITQNEIENLVVMS